MRLSDASHARFERLKAWLGPNRTRIVEIAVGHLLASLEKGEGINVPDPSPGGATSPLPAASSPPLRVVAKRASDKARRAAR